MQILLSAFEQSAIPEDTPSKISPCHALLLLPLLILSAQLQDLLAGPLTAHWSSCPNMCQDVMTVVRLQSQHRSLIKLQ